MESNESRLAALKLELPPPPRRSASIGRSSRSTVYSIYRATDRCDPDGSLTKGRVGADLDVAAGYQAARQTGLAILATLQKHCGSLDKIARLVKTFGLGPATPEFVDHPAVINGFSELMRDVFGEEHGVAARSAVGAVSLPGGMAVEVEAIFELVR